jgi:hypothetical protein
MLLIALAVIVAVSASAAVPLLTRDNGGLLAQTGAEFLEQEAGPALYMNAGHALNLSDARAAYRNIEMETADYIIGSVPLPSFPSSVTEDVHCYVHKDGWIVVYYLKEEPLSKIVSNTYWVGGELTRTKLDEGMEKMCNTLGITQSGVKKYHFQWPSANDWEMVAGTSAFNIKVPSSFIVYERSYYSSYSCAIDGHCFVPYSGGYGVISPSYLVTDQFHTVGGCPGYSMGLVVICLVYQNPS